MERVFALATAIVTVALVAVLVQSPNTASVIREAGNVFTGSIREAQSIR